MGCNDTFGAHMIINTHRKYTKPFRMLMHSLFASGFTNFDDIIVVRAGYTRPAPPKKATFAFGEKTNVTFTEIKWDAAEYDYHAYQALRHFSNVLNARAYVYTLDTTIASPVFAQAYRRLTRRMDPCDETMLTTKYAASNIAILSHRCMLQVTGNLSLRGLNKQDAILIEKSEHTRFAAPGDFCTKSFVKPRYKVGDYTIYDPNIWRSLYYYPTFGLYKPIRH